MNVKIMIKLFLIIFIVLDLLFFPKVYALSMDNMLKDGKSFLGCGNSISSTMNTAKLQETSSDIYQIFLTIGIVVSVIVGAVLGIQMIYASVEGKAKVLESLIPYIVGCVIVFGAFFIWKIVISIGNKTESSITSSSSTYTAPSGTTHTGGGRNFLEV